VVLGDRAWLRVPQVGAMLEAIPSIEADVLAFHKDGTWDLLTGL